SSAWQSIAFLEPSSFSAIVLPTRDSSTEMQVLKDYQALIAAQSNKKEPQLSIALHIDRLEWAWQQTGSLLSWQNEYKKRLQQIIQSFPDNPATVRAVYSLATIEINNEKDRRIKKPGSNGLLRADSLISVTLQKKVVRTPETIALQNLQAEIRRPNLEATMEAVYMPEEPLLTLIKYQNIARVFVRVVALKPDEWEKYSSQKKPSEASLITKKALQEKIWNLPKQEDLRMNATEIYLEPLPAGQYLLITATQKELNDNAATISLTPFQVSSIATIQQGNHWIALHRTTGKPLPKAAFQFYSSYSSSEGIGFRKINTAKGISDSLGQFYFNYTNEYANGLSIKYQEEELLLLGKIFSGTDESTRIKNNREGKRESRVQIFTDRKIFRPGQIVFWKAIGSVKDTGSSAPALMPEGTKLKFYLKDAQDIVIDSIEKSLNSFGSCHGTFEIPKDRLTGNFSITSSVSRYQQANILVEEYKRPRFTVAWENPKQGYSLLDSIQMTGYTRSFAGNILENANVKYRIKRSQWYGWRGSRSGSLEIGSGITTTDKEGKFRIQFSPLRTDENGNDELGPFNFEITADVTDASGESRTAQTIIYAGSQSVFLEWQVKEVMGEKDWKNIRLFTGNLSGEKISSPVKVSLYALQTPKKTLRKKYWEAPDQVILGESIFREKFPLDEYGDELNPSNWQRVRIVAADSFTTRKNGTLNLSEQMPEPGYYRLVTTTKDPVSGKLIETVTHFQIIHESGNKKQVFSNAIWHQNETKIDAGDFMEGRLITAESDAHLLINKID
ncbi:MAG: MG2 domain-containing protein, partial [Sediminibacterium sp.]